MIKSTLTAKRERIERGDIGLILSGMLVGTLTHEMGIVVVMVYLAILSRKSWIIYLSGVLGMLFSMLLCDVFYLYIVAGATLATLVFVKGYEKMHWDSDVSLAFLHGVIVVFGFYYLKEISLAGSTALSIVILELFFFRIPKEKQDILCVLFVICGSAYFYLMQYMPLYNVWHALGIMVIFAYFMPFEICFSLSVYFALQGIPILYLLLALLISFGEGKRMEYSFFTLLAVVLLPGMISIVFSVSCIMMGFFSYKEQSGFMDEMTRQEKSHQLYMQHSFYRQLMDYSSIFYDLSKYYQDVSLDHSQMLKIMGEAMEQNAKVSKQYFYHRDEMQKGIVDALKGYKFTVYHASYQKEDDKIRIMLEVGGLYKGEVEDVILPLLEKLSESRLHVVCETSGFLHRDHIKIVMESEKYNTVSVYSDSLYVREVNGDSYHSTSFNDNVVCMMSDGMGQGNKAAKVSSILIHMLETMMRCEIPQAECVKLLNQFMRSDIYATLDILSFDRKRNVAYLSKSASAPTYLYRDGILHEMNAKSLPIGIVENIQADVFEIPFYKGDIFLMISDGISSLEVEKWTSLKRMHQVKNEGINMMKILKERKRMDDSSFMMVMIS